MAVPKKKTSKSKTRMRKAHKGLSPVQIVVDKDSGEYRLAHRICKEDGRYRGKQIVDIKEEKEEDSAQE